jgi:hypothetical protein
MFVVPCVKSSVVFVLNCASNLPALKYRFVLPSGNASVSAAALSTAGAHSDPDHLRTSPVDGLGALT